MRGEKLLKRPGIAETIDWAHGALTLADEGSPWPDALRRSLGLLLKEQEDRRRRSEALLMRRGGDRAREHLFGFLRALDDAGVMAAAPKRADFLRAVARLAAGRRGRALLARAG